MSMSGPVFPRRVWNFESVNCRVNSLPLHLPSATTSLPRGHQYGACTDFAGSELVLKRP